MPINLHISLLASCVEVQFSICDASLQDVTVCPFRVVDEINQGMDPINERKVFMQLVESACRPGTPQCFLLTPKLLPALPFTPAVQILQIWNGPAIKQVTGNYREVCQCGCMCRLCMCYLRSLCHNHHICLLLGL